MICALTQKQHNALLKKVAKDVFTMIEAKTAFNIDDYVKYIYDRVYTKTNDQARAVTFASLVPNKLVIARAHSAKIKNPKEHSCFRCRMRTRKACQNIT